MEVNFNNPGFCYVLSVLVLTIGSLRPVKSPFAICAGHFQGQVLFYFSKTVSMLKLEVCLKLSDHLNMFIA